MRNWESRAGTCLMATTIFMMSPCVQRDGTPALLLIALENQAAVGAAEPEGVRQRVVDLHRTRVVRDVIQIARRVGTSRG